MSLPDPVALQRFRYQQGQALRSDDRRDRAAIAAQLQAWHNRALHNAFGVVEGMTVQLQANAALVDPGLAYDSRGRGLILQQLRTVTFPRTSGSTPTAWLLLARFKDTSEYPKRSSFDPGCLSNLFLESPEFLWKQEKEWTPQDGVPLTSITIAANVVTANAEFVKPREHGLARHRVVTGATLQGGTDWTPWNLTVANKPVELGFQVKIDTSQSGFTQAPSYFAWLQRVADKPGDTPFLSAIFEHIAEESFKGFTFRLWLPPLIMPAAKANTIHRVNNQFAARLDARRQLYVSWMAIEEGPGSASTHDHKGVPHEHS